MHRSSQFNQFLRTPATEANQLALVVSQEGGRIGRLQGSFLLRNLGDVSQTVNFLKSSDASRVKFNDSTGAPERAAMVPAGPVSSGTYTLSSNAANTNTSTIDGQAYTFKTSLASAYDVLIGPTKEATIKNYADAINGPGYGILDITAAGTITTSGDATVVVSATGMTGSPITIALPVVNGTFQVETATLAGGPVTTSGNITITVTAAGLVGSPLAVPVAVVQGTLQMITATIAGTITGAGDVRLVVTAAGLTGSPRNVDFAVLQGAIQQHTATVVGTVTTSGNIGVTVTAAVLAGSPLTIPVAVSAGVQQVETATIVGTISADGDINVTVTAAGMPGSPKTVPVAVLNTDSAAQVAENIAGVLVGDGDIGPFFSTIGSDGPDVVFTRLVGAANDATLNMAYDNGTSAGLTPNSTSADTTAGEAADDADAVAVKIRAALNAESDITDVFTVGGSGADVTLTALVAADNDPTMNIGLSNDDAAGINEEAFSTETNTGSAPDSATVVATKARTALGLDAEVPGFFTVGGSGVNITLTALTKADNDATMNLSSANLTSTGLTDAPTSVNTTPGVAQDTAALAAGKARTALSGVTAITDFFAVSGAGANIILTADAKAANDTTMLIAIDGGSTGLSTVATSANTVPGVAPDTAELWAAKLVTALQGNVNIAAKFTVTRSGAAIRLFKTGALASDTALSISVADDTCVGISAGVGAGTGVSYGAATVANPDVSATYSGNVMTVAAKSDGSAGDAITTTSTVGTWSGATLSGGVTSVPPGSIKSVLIDEECSIFGISLPVVAGVVPNLQVSGTLSYGYTAFQGGVQARLRDPAEEELTWTADHSVVALAGTPVVVAAGATDIYIEVPSSHSVTVDDGTVSYTVAAGGTIHLYNESGAAFTNAFTFTRATGSGSINISVTR